MYIQSKTSQIAGPGTALVQRIDGFGMYLPSTCNDQTPGSGSAFQTENYGLGCADCKGKCGGMGFFDSGIDPAGWGAMEWGAVLLGGYMLMSTVFTTRRAARVVGRKVKRARRRMAATA